MRFFLLITLLSLASFAKASVRDSIAQQIFYEIYNQHYTTANSLLQENKTVLDSFYFTVLKVDMSYWKNVTGTNNPDYDAFETDLDQCKIVGAKSFNQKAILLITLSYQLRYELKRFRIFDALSTRRKTINLFEELKTAKGDLSPDYQKIFLLYDALFVYFDNRHKPFFIPNKKRNCQQALQTMVELAKSEHKIMKTLSCYFLGKTYLKYEKEPEKALEYFNWLAAKYPDNPKFPELLNECKEQLD